MKFKYDTQTLQWMKLFEDTTKAKVKDFFLHQDRLCFIVQAGHLRRGLGPNKKNVEKMQKLTGRRIKVVEHSDDVERFISNVFAPLKIVKMEIEDGVVTITGPDQKTKGLMIGAQARNLRLFESVVQKYFPEIKEIKVI